jgi:hypothetical protein
MPRRLAPVLAHSLTAASILLSAQALWAAESLALAVQADQGTATVTENGQPVMAYRFDDVASKPYVQMLAAPSGQNILRDSPADHVHHHGLMLGLTIDGVVFWEERGAFGIQKHMGFRRLESTSRNALGQVVIEEDLDWLTADGRRLLDEARTITLQSHQKGQPRLLTWRSDLTPGPQAGESATITGRRYFGLGVRFIREMDAKSGYHFNAAGGRGRAETDEHRAAWSAYTAPTGPETWATFAMFDDPQNPRHPADWFAMGEGQHFAYLTATMAVDEEPIELPRGETLRLRYGVAVFDGQATPEQVEAAYQAWKGE